MPSKKKASKKKSAPKKPSNKGVERAQKKFKKSARELDMQRHLRDSQDTEYRKSKMGSDDFMSSRGYESQGLYRAMRREQYNFEDAVRESGRSTPRKKKAAKKKGKKK